MKAIAAIGVAVLAGLGAIASGDSTIDPAHPYAYGSNIGWINSRADGTFGAVIGQYYCVGYIYSANVGWVSLGGGFPANGHTYGNGSADDFGVNHNGEGGLSGCAWGANVGWISFEATGNPRVDLRTGILSGFVWGANVGWIGLSNVQAYVRTQTLAPGPDADKDGLPDAWERKYGRNLNDFGGGTHDKDNDGVSDTDEYLADTNPDSYVDWFGITGLAVLPETNTVTWSSRPTRLYRVEATNTLPSTGTDWVDVGGGLLGPPTGPSMQAEIPVSSTPTTRFYRVHAVLPLAP